MSDITNSTVGLGPLGPLMNDPDITDILVNGPNKVYVERMGVLEKAPVEFQGEEEIIALIERIALYVGRQIDTKTPMADLRLPDGTRVNATLNPASVDGPTISIRRFGRRRLRRVDLVAHGMLSDAMVELLEVAVRLRKNILVSGGTGAGKSTLLSAIAEAIPNTERIVTIEDIAELMLDQEHVVRMETRPPNIDRTGAITTRDLVVNSLRMRPDRIIVGEVRQGEALDMLQAFNTGHNGSMGTIHANSPRDAVARLETMVLMAGIDLPSRAIREQIVSAISLFVHVRRFEDGIRRVESISEITGLEGNTPLMQEIFSFRRRVAPGVRVAGEYLPTGIVPRFFDDLRDAGVEPPVHLMTQRRIKAGV